MRLYELKATANTIPSPHTLIGQIAFKVPAEQQLTDSDATDELIRVTPHTGMARILFEGLKRDHLVREDAEEPEFVHIQEPEQIAEFSPVTVESLDMLSMFKPNIESRIYRAISPETHKIISGEATLSRVELRVVDLLRRQAGSEQSDYQESELLQSWVMPEEDRHWQPVPASA